MLISRWDGDKYIKYIKSHKKLQGTPPTVGPHAHLMRKYSNISPPAPTATEEEASRYHQHRAPGLGNASHKSSLEFQVVIERRRVASRGKHHLE